MSRTVGRVALEFTSIMLDPTPGDDLQLKIASDQRDTGEHMISAAARRRAGQ
jgi:hypothetical protein